MPYRPPEDTLTASIWMPHFEIQVERWREPALIGLPVVVIASGSLPRVIRCSPEAEAAGVKPNVPLREVMAAAPGAALRTADTYFYGETFARAIADLESISPLIEIVTPGSAFVGLEGLVSGEGLRGLRRCPEGTPGIYRSPRLLMAALERAVQPPWVAFIGIGLGKFAARALARIEETDRPGLLVSRTGKTRWIPEDQQEAFLRSLPVQLLPVSVEMRRKLLKFGLRTLGQLAALPLSAAVAQFGKEGRRAWMLAYGRDEEGIRPRTAPVEVRETLTFPEPTASLDTMMVGAQQLLERSLRRPEMQGRGVRQLRLDAGLESGRHWTGTINLRQPGALPATLFPPICYHLDREHPAEAVETLTLVLAAFTTSPGVQGSLFPEPREEREARVVEAMRQIRTHLGRAPISKIVEVEPWSRVPERRYHLINYDP